MKVGAPATGFVDDMTVSPPGRVSSFPLPAGVSLRSVRLVTFHAARPFGNTALALADTLDDSTSCHYC